MGPPDAGLFRVINEGPQSLGPLMRFFSEAVNYPAVKVVLGLFVLAMLAAKDLTRRTVVQALIAVGIANGLTDIFKAVLPEKRPYQELESVFTIWGGTTASHGTASAHSANMAAVAFVFCYHVQWWGTPWIAIALITGYSRVFVGAHYPHQVLLGWCCGLFAAAAVVKGWELYCAKRSVKTASNSPAPSED